MACDVYVTGWAWALVCIIMKVFFRSQKDVKDKDKINDKAITDFLKRCMDAEVGCTTELGPLGGHRSISVNYCDYVVQVQVFLFKSPAAPSVKPAAL